MENAPKGSAQIRRHNKGLQFFHRKENGVKNGVYIPVSDRGRAIALVQKRYLQKLCISSKKQLQIIQNFLNSYIPDALEAVYLEEGELRRALIRPVELPDELYAAQWQAVEYTGKSFPENAQEHYTLNKERVRSKSEVLIADTLSREKIPYRYEYPLKIGSQTIYPNFTILRLQDRKELFWEHLGLMDDPEYRELAFRKIRNYEAAGIFPGDRLILTAETGRMPFNTRVAEMMINHYINTTLQVLRYD